MRAAIYDSGLKEIQVLTPRLGEQHEEKSFHRSDFLNMNMLVFVFAFAIYSCKVVNLPLFRCGVCPVASKSTVYLLCVALLLLPAHVCLGFWDRSPGPADHTCGERELSTRTSSSMTKKKRKNKKLQSTVRQ